MSMSAGGNGGKRVLSEINVTPLVDVMLVLLIVFMVTTPFIVEDNGPRKVEVELPPTSAEPVKASEMQTLMIITKEFELKLSLGKEPSSILSCKKEQDYKVCLEPLEGKIKDNPKLQGDQRVFLLADRSLPYGFVADVMARMKNAGIMSLALVTNPPEEGL